MLPLSSYSTFFIEENAKDKLLHFSHYFDSITGMHLSTLKSYQSGVYLIEKDYYDKIGESIMEELTGNNVSDNLRIISTLNSASKEFDFKDNNLGALTSIVYAEMGTGNDIDMRIVAESVMNRWERRETESDFKIGRKTIVTNLRQLIEMPGQYVAISRKDKATSIIIYADIMGHYNKLVETSYEFMEKFGNPKFTKAIEVSYQVYKEMSPKIYFGVTHYVSDPLLSTYFDGKSRYEDLIHKDQSLTKIKGNKKVTDAARQIPE